MDYLHDGPLYIYSLHRNTEFVYGNSLYKILQTIYLYRQKDGQGESSIPPPPSAHQLPRTSVPGSVTQKIESNTPVHPNDVLAIELSPMYMFVYHTPTHRSRTCVVPN